MLQIPNRISSICQLFAGGSLRMLHILYQPGALDDQFFSRIDLACPQQIPMITSDTTEQGICPADLGQRTDHILQLIFLSDKQLAQSFSSINDLLTFYRIFIFPAMPDQQDNTTRLQTFQVLTDTNSSALLTQHDTATDGTSLYILPHQLNSSITPVQFMDKIDSGKSFFNLVLGENVLKRNLGVFLLDSTTCDLFVHRGKHRIVEKSFVWAKLYFAQMHMNYINMLSCGEDGSQEFNPVIHSRSLSYSEFSSHYEKISKD